MNTAQKLTSNLKPASAQRPALPIHPAYPTGARLSATAPAALSPRDGLNAGARGPAPPVVVADESTRAVLRSHLSAHDRNPFKQEFAIMRGPHGPATPLGDQAGDSVELLGEEKAARHGIVLRILLPDGGSITLRPQLRGPVHPTVITKAKFKWQGKQRPML